MKIKYLQKDHFQLFTNVIKLLCHFCKNNIVNQIDLL